ncbi:uncharacterized protein [Zea mays]|uniref:uncharacterized protein isoform X1 n=1 Tax=Zea mays TaxID=4577 RepID=UPI0004DEC18A|nr:uncharacterized protein LOC103626119 isoform X1 [Zea mays]XP_008644717.1 uncharacterized protein LOC103626119 isoform X1 [Zea mays]XP_008644718.1 uncharacterized protein LOC103626119 isoform X1 [Zea mays]|eukprot:XP_008644716.1 uncharacterized protein LOC103626119 isoform X1 [Zea mays]
MRDPFDAPVDLINVDHNGGYQLSRTGAVSAGDHGLQNGGPKSLAPNSDTVVSRHQLQGASLHKDLALEDPNTRIMDPETKELYFRSQSQEDEILLLRKKIAEASLKELSLLSEKHILERRLTDLRMAVDEKQEEAISGALKQLNQKKTHLEDNMRLANELKVEEEELYFFTSSLLSMLAEYNIRPPQINASTITIGTKRLYQQMHWKLKSLNDNLGDMPQPGNIYNSSHQQQQVTLPRNEASPSYNMVSNKNALQQYAQGPSDRHIEQMYHGSSFQQDTGGTTPSNYFEEGRVDGGSQLYPSDGDALPGIEGFQIAGEPRPGCQLTACGFPTNGTTLCNFQWVRHLENGIKQSIEGATMYDYVVTADDVGTLLAVDCTPMDDNGRQGDLVTEFANNGNKITCDPEMQSHIDACISKGRAEFEVFVLQAYSPEEWELATLVLTRPNYQIKFKQTGNVVIDEKYSQSLQTKIPNGRTTQFVLITAGTTLPFNTQGISEPNNEDYDVRLRDLIVLVMRTFQKKALDAKRKGKA